MNQPRVREFKSYDKPVSEDEHGPIAVPGPNMVRLPVRFPYRYTESVQFLKKNGVASNCNSKDSQERF